MTRLLSQAKASLKIFQELQNGGLARQATKATGRARQKIKSVPLVKKLRVLGFATREELQAEISELRARIEALEEKRRELG